MKNALARARYLLSETAYERLPPSEAEITFIGRSNVGKSSLLCALCENKRLAVVSKTPGRTRKINVFEAVRGKWLVDLPGFGYAAAAERERDYWPKMIGRYLNHRASLSCIFHLIDADIGPGAIDLSVLTWLRENNKPHQLVITKVDRLGRSRQAIRRTELATILKTAADDLLWVSAKEGYGMKELRREASNALGV